MPSLLCEFGEQCSDVAIDRVPDRADVGQTPPRRVVDLPVVAQQSRTMGRDITAAHRHEHICSIDGLRCQGLREVAAERHSDLVEGGDHRGPHVLGRVGPGCPNEETITGQMTEHRSGELRPSGIVHTDEQDRGPLVKGGGHVVGVLEPNHREGRDT